MEWTKSILNVLNLDICFCIAPLYSSYCISNVISAFAYFYNILQNYTSLNYIQISEIHSYLKFNRCMKTEDILKTAP